MTEFEEQVKEFSAKLALVPIPPPGPLHVVSVFIIMYYVVIFPTSSFRSAVLLVFVGVSVGV